MHGSCPDVSWHSGSWQFDQWRRWHGGTDNKTREEIMDFRRTQFLSGFIGLSLICAPAVHAADLIVSAQDGKFVRVEGKATYPQPAPPDSLVVIDAAQSPPAIVATVEGI
jgi:hypothetical protein